MFPKVEILILNNKKNLTPKIFGFFGLGVGLGFGFFWVFGCGFGFGLKKPKPNPKTQFFLGSGD
jgi:hypothetical protein